MNTIISNSPEHVAFLLRREALHLLEWGMNLSGVCDGIAWHIQASHVGPTVYNPEVVVTLLIDGVWGRKGTFTIHELTIDAVFDYIRSEIEKEKQ